MVCSHLQVFYLMSEEAHNFEDSSPKYRKRKERRLMRFYKETYHIKTLRRKCFQFIGHQLKPIVKCAFEIVKSVNEIRCHILFNFNPVH